MNEASVTKNLNFLVVLVKTRFLKIKYITTSRVIDKKAVSAAVVKLHNRCSPTYILIYNSSREFVIFY